MVSRDLNANPINAGAVECSIKNSNKLKLSLCALENHFS